jgi:uncharacterized damage-inducible protein DinB
MKLTMTVLLFAASLTFAFGQTQSPAPSSSTTTAASTPSATKDPVTAALKMMLPIRQKHILAAIDAMPADKFSYKPTADQMTFGHLVVHIIESNNDFCAKAADVPAPKAAEVKDTDSKDKLATAAKASFDFCADALGKMTDAKLGDSVELFGGRQYPRATAALVVASAWADHYGAAAMYLRMNNILPPSAQPKK